MVEIVSAERRIAGLDGPEVRAAGEVRSASTVSFGIGVVGIAASRSRVVAPEIRRGTEGRPSISSTRSSPVWNRSAGSLASIFRMTVYSRRSSGVLSTGSGIGSMMCL